MEVTKKESDYIRDRMVDEFIKNPLQEDVPTKKKYYKDLNTRLHLPSLVNWVKRKCKNGNNKQ